MAMSEVNVEVNGRSYLMACEVGEEDHVRELARVFSGYVEGIKSEFREAGDSRLAVMAGIMLVDQMRDIERRVAELEGELNDLSEAGRALSREHKALEGEYAERFAALAERIQGLAGELERAGVAARG
ncbi:MAG: cell division protein ZapA [Cucumibacter sp.]